jgi:hypothetical protein
MTDKKLSALDRARAMQEAEPWTPEVGDEIVGKLIGIKKGTSDFGDYPLIVLDLGAAFRSVHAFHRILRARLIEAAPKNGDEIAIRREPDLENKKGKEPVRDFTVTVNGEVGTNFDWATI